MGLVRKEVLSIQSDPRSPEHGQYGFLQDLVRRVAYETLSKRERKARHLATAAYLEGAFPTEHEVVEVLASHYLAAYEAVPGDDDAAEIQQRACDLLARAGERSASLAASAEAQHYFEQAAALAEDRLEEARLLERAGEMALRAGDTQSAQGLLEQALALLTEVGEVHQGARVLARLGEVFWTRGRLDDALERLERAWNDLEGEEPDADIATLAAAIGRVHLLRGELEPAAARLETALELAESLWLPEVLAEALDSSGVVMSFSSRLQQAQALIERALALALEYELPAAALRAYHNLGDVLSRLDRCAEATAQYEAGIALARRVGHRRYEDSLLGERSWSLALAGRWSEMFASREQVPDDRILDMLPSFLLALAEPLAAQGRLGDARDLLALHASYEDTADFQRWEAFRAVQSVVLRAEGDAEGALAAAEEVLASALETRPADPAVKVAFPQALEAALALGEVEKARNLLDRIESLPPGRFAPSLRAHAARFRARLAGAEGDGSSAEGAFAHAAAIFREFGMPFWLAVTQVEHGEWLAAQGKADEAEPLLAEASATFERLEAMPWLERVAAVAGQSAEVTVPQPTTASPS